jgi:hypothetical protein
MNTIELQETKIYFDRIRINVKLSMYKLSKLLPVQDLQRHCKSISLNYASRIARKYRFESNIEIVAVKDKELFRILSQYEVILSKHKVSYLEIAGDTAYSGKEESLNAFEILLKNAVKAYTSQCHVFDMSKQDRKLITDPTKEEDKEKYSDRSKRLINPIFTGLK